MIFARLIFSAFLFTILATVASAAPAKGKFEPLALDSFFGDWQGVAIAMSETDEDFPTSKRDIAVTIAKTDLSGFLISWSTLQRQKGNPKAPLEVMKSTTVEFVPVPTQNQWRAKADADPYNGGVLYWARLDGSGLVISSFAINQDGKPEFQTYRRHIVGPEMKLEFSNVKDGKFVRTVKGSLRKIKNR